MNEESLEQPSPLEYIESVVSNGTTEGGFKKELEDLINRYSMENLSNTPDYILAEYLMGCLRVYANAINMRDGWYDFDPWRDNNDSGGE